jgi:hypothetical protein
MTASSDLPSLYSLRPVNLWVEDDETRAYLDRAWQDPDIGYLVAGGGENVAAVVKSAREAGLPTVFGLRDRDFNSSNRSRWRRWTDPLAVFALDSLEIENFALDAEAIADVDANTAGLTAAQIEGLLQRAVNGMVWYMACRYTVSDIRDAVARDFLKHPRAEGPRALTSFAAARDWILDSPWWKDVLPAATAHVTASGVELALGWHHLDLAHGSAADCPP